MSAPGGERFGTAAGRMLGMPVTQEAVELEPQADLPKLGSGLARSVPVGDGVGQGAPCAFGDERPHIGVEVEARPISRRKYSRST